MSDEPWQQVRLPPPDFMRDAPQRNPAEQLAHIVAREEIVSRFSNESVSKSWDLVLDFVQR